MVLISTQIEIASPPERVRETFLNFEKYSDWAHGFIQSIEPVLPKDPHKLAEGDTLKVALPGMTFSPTVLENSPQEFKWRGSLPYIFTGDHSFRFEPSKNTPGSTTLVQSESFSGLLAPMMQLPFGMGKTTAPGFQKFNEDIKRRVESTK